MNWNNKAFLYTAVFYTLVLFMFLFLGFTTPLPLPAEQGILINFGDDETGSGQFEPKPVEDVREQSSPQPTTPVESEVVEEQMTQDYEEAPAVAQTKKEAVKPQEKKAEQKTEVKKEPVKEEKPMVNASALYQGRKSNSESTSSEGEAGGSGNQGSLSGDTETKNRSLGTGVGDGIGYDLTGRSPVALPKPEFNVQKEGKVVVRIRVDRTGKVTFAEPGVKGSTTLDKELLAAAKKAALASRFNNKADAALIQEGTITYVFRLSK